MQYDIFQQFSQLETLGFHKEGGKSYHTNFYLEFEMIKLNKIWEGGICFEAVSPGKIENPSIKIDEN